MNVEITVKDFCMKYGQDYGFVRTASFALRTEPDNYYYWGAVFDEKQLYGLVEKSLEEKIALHRAQMEKQEEKLAALRKVGGAR